MDELRGGLYRDWCNEEKSLEMCMHTYGNFVRLRDRSASVDQEEVKEEGGGAEQVEVWDEEEEEEEQAKEFQRWLAEVEELFKKCVG